jgi:hypothetical protein
MGHPEAARADGRDFRSATSHPRRPGIKVHRRKNMDVTRRKGIPVTSPIQTLMDIASRLDGPHLERVVNEAVNRDLTTPDRLRNAADGQPALRTLLDRDTFVLTDTEHEQRFVRQDRLRDHAHFKARLIPLRFTHWQIYYEPDYVEETLSVVASDPRRPRTPGLAPAAAAR